jgi:hypothetical protein
MECENESSDRDAVDTKILYGDGEKSTSLFDKVFLLTEAIYSFFQLGTSAKGCGS